jgi:hypothetical protein
MRVGRLYTSQTGALGPRKLTFGPKCGQSVQADKRNPLDSFRPLRRRGRQARALRPLRPVHAAKGQALFDQLNNGLRFARPNGVKRTLILNLRRQCGRDPKPKHPRSNMRRSSQALGLYARHSNRRRTGKHWQLKYLQFFDGANLSASGQAIQPYNQIGG